jgi:hypothetical protein
LPLRLAWFDERAGEVELDCAETWQPALHVVVGQGGDAFRKHWGSAENEATMWTGDEPLTATESSVGACRRGGDTAEGVDNDSGGLVPVLAFPATPAADPAASPPANGETAVTLPLFSIVPREVRLSVLWRRAGGESGEAPLSSLPTPTMSSAVSVAAPPPPLMEFTCTSTPVVTLDE